MDEYHGDQILIYAALAKGLTKFATTRELSMHFQTLLVLLPMFCDIEITTGREGNVTLVEVTGLAKVHK